jgi:hypothetical protein
VLNLLGYQDGNGKDQRLLHRDLRGKRQTHAEDRVREPRLQVVESDLGVP